MMMTSDQLGKIETQISETQAKIDDLEKLGKAAPKGTIRGLRARIAALQAMVPVSKYDPPIETGDAR